MDKFYLSEERFKELELELENLKTEGRRKIAEKLKQAKELGDLSENAEYQEARNEQDFLEQRINQLEEIIRNAEIVKKKKGGDVVSIGSKVKVKKNDSVAVYTIVGSNEAKPTEGLISNESPLGKSLLGKRVGERVTIKTPKGEISYQIVAID